MWFRNGRRYDALIHQRFGDLWLQAEDGSLDHWAQTARGCLALVVLLDQFSRHIHRGTARAFMQDGKAQRIVLDGLRIGLDKELWAIEKTFYLLPLEHAEDYGLQKLSVGLYQAIFQFASSEVKQTYELALDFANAHYDVISQFGRFPERNRILGRASTTRELVLLKQPKVSFV